MTVGCERCNALLDEVERELAKWLGPLHKARAGVRLLRGEAGREDAAMATKTQIEALVACAHAAKAAGHIFPAAAACEGAVETGWFTSLLYLRENNVFGTKQHQHPIYETVSLPTREYLGNKWTIVNALWVSYPTVADSFADRMQTLRTLAPAYPHYAAALAATTPEEYLTQVSMSWSTGPTRGEQCVEILHAHADILSAFDGQVTS